MGLVEWVWNLYAKGKLILGVDVKLVSGVDEKLRMEFDEKPIECLMIVG